MNKKYILFALILGFANLKSFSQLQSSSQPQTIQTPAPDREKVENFLIKNYPFPKMLDSLGVIYEYNFNAALTKFVYRHIIDFYEGIHQDVASHAITSKEDVAQRFTHFIDTTKQRLAQIDFPKDPPIPSHVPNKSLNGPCVNMDFEDGTTNGWDLFDGQVDGSVTYSYTGNTPVGPGASHLITTGGTDPVCGIPMVSPFGGGVSCRLGDGTVTGYGAARMSQTFMVSPANCIFSYAYAVVLEDPGHTAAQQPYFTLRVYDQLGNNVNCGVFSVYASSSSPFNFLTAGTDVLYSNWTQVFAQLSTYIGQNVTIEFTSGDCGAGGHYGYAYVDANCQPFDITTSTGDTILCAGDVMTLYAPPGGTAYLWNTGATTQTIPITTPGHYTVQVTPFQGALCNITLDIDVTGLPKPVAAFNPVPTNICAGGSVNITDQSTISSGTIQSWQWDFGDGISTPASSGAITGVSQTTGTYTNPVHTYPTPGNYTISLTVTGTGGHCDSTITHTITVGAPVTIVIAGDTNICNGQSTSLTASGASTYTWVPAITNGVAFVPPLGNTVYTVTGTSVSGCTSTKQTTVVVNPLPTVNAGPDVAVCPGTQVTLTATGASTYTWVPAVTNGVAFTPPVGVTNYTVTGTDANGCTNTDQVVVTANSGITINAGTDQTVCDGTSVTLTATGAGVGGIYTWDNGVNNAVPFVPAVGTITYTVNGTDINGCTGTDQVNVTVNPLPTFTTSHTNPTICGSTDGTITLSGLTPSTSFNVTYSDGGTPVGPTAMNSNGTGDIVISGLNAGNYTNFTVATAAGCSTTVAGPETLVDPNPPMVNPVTSQTVCHNTAVTAINFSGTAGATFSWTNSATSIGLAASGTGNIASFTGTNPGATAVTANLTVTPTLAGCTGTAQNFTITINPLPPVNAGTDQTLCDDGTQITLSGSGASTYTWNNGVTNGTPFSQAVGTTTYTVSGTDGNGCVNTDQVNVTVNPLPNVNAGIDQTLCNNGTQITLTGSGASSYTWNNGVTNGTAFSQAVGTTSYIVAGTDGNGCINWDTVNVTVNPLPPVNAGVDQTVCVGTSVTLGGSGASTYTWNNGVTNGTAFTPSVGIVAYTVTGTDGNGCTNTDQVNVTVNPLPNVVAGNDVIVCQVGTVILTGAGAVNYTWNNGVTNGVSFPAPSDTTTYVVTGTDANGCVNKDSLVVNVVPTPVVNFTADRLSGCSPLSVQFTNNSTGNLTDCQWSFSNGQNVTGCGTVSGTFTQTGCYDVTLTVSTPEGCTNTATIADYVCVDPNPVADFTTDPTELSTEEWTAHMVNSSIGASTYLWTFSDGSANTTDFAPLHDFPNEQSGTYTISLTVTSSAGCIDSTSRTIHLVEHLIFYVPNTFTPDHDDFNETFKPIFTTGFDPYDYSLLIFDRWGELLFESHNTEVGWDGTYGGKIVQDGTYIWKIDVKRRDSDEHIRKIGHVNVMR